ncbi:serine/threonine-protein kinase DCLK3 [Aplochiton taeniatus]
MTAWRARQGCQPMDTRWKTAAPPVSVSKRLVGAPWPPQRHLHPGGAGSRTQGLPPLSFPLFHTRHAEQSAERPRLITVVRPSAQNPLRKVTVLLNRRGVVSFEQLLLDVSEALGFPRWHRARVTRLYTPHAREVKGVCDFFRGEVAFLAFGKAHPALLSVEEALEELFPESCHYREDALRAWERRLRPPPDKAAKADSGYSEGTDDPDAPSRDTKKEANTLAGHLNKHRLTHPLHNTDVRRNADHKSDSCNNSHLNANTCRQPTHPPNHLQRIRVRGGTKERQPSITGPFKQEDGQCEELGPLSSTQCQNCLWGVTKGQSPGSKRPSPRSGKVPLPPVTRKQERSTLKELEVRSRDTSPASPQSQPMKEGKRSLSPSECLSSCHLERVDSKREVREESMAFNLPPDKSDVTLSDVERWYDIGRVVGDGNFAVVHECRRRDNGETVAMKIVERSKLIGREHMMQNELSLLGSLCHPRVVRLITHHHTDTHSYLIMELVAGGDLFEAIARRGKFSEEEAGLMVSDVSEALGYIHSKSIVHRDLKPENLLLENKGNGRSRLKLGDFGLAMVVTEPIFTVCGTPTYVAPEILSETGYGLAVDVWALGVILYILLSGFPPFRSRDRDQEELFLLIKRGELHFLSPYWDPISEGAKGLVIALLQVEPTERLTAAQALQHPWLQPAASAYSQGALTHDRDHGKSDQLNLNRNRPAHSSKEQHPSTAADQQGTLKDTLSLVKLQQRPPGQTCREVDSVSEITAAQHKDTSREANRISARSPTNRNTASPSSALPSSITAVQPQPRPESSQSPSQRH